MTNYVDTSMISCIKVKASLELIHSFRSEGGIAPAVKFKRDIDSSFKIEQFSSNLPILALKLIILLLFAPLDKINGVVYSFPGIFR